jgi:hypothetical protein
MKELLQEYAECKVVEKANADRIDELKPLIVEEMRKIDADKVETEFGNFTLGTMARWQYSPSVTNLQEEEKANGKAKQIVSTVLRFTGIKAE